MQQGITSRLHDAIVVFGRFLRQAGYPVGTGEIMNAIESSTYIDIINRGDFRQSMKACFVTDYRFVPLFDKYLIFTGVILIEFKMFPEFLEN